MTMTGRVMVFVVLVVVDTHNTVKTFTRIHGRTMVVLMLTPEMRSVLVVVVLVAVVIAYTTLARATVLLTSSVDITMVM